VCTSKSSKFSVAATTVKLNFKLPSHLLSGINQHGGFTLPPDSDFEINNQYESSLHPINAGSGFDRLDVLFDQNSLSSLLLNNDTSDDDGAEGLECSPELQKMMNDLGSLLMPLDSRKQQSIDSGKGKNTGGRPMIQITKEDLWQCKGRTLVAVADELNVSICTLKRRLEDLTGYKKWTHFRRSKSFPRCVPIYVDYRRGKNTIRSSSFNSKTRTVAKANKEYFGT